MPFTILDSLTEADRRRVLASTVRRRFSRREVLFHEDDPGDTLHLIEKGRIVVRITTPAGDIATVDILGRGSAVGMFAVLGEGRRRAATVMALEVTETLAISRDQFQALLREHPSIQQFALDVLCTEIRRLDALLLEALFSPVETRVLRRLQRLTVLYGGEAVRAVPVEIGLTQQDLAWLAGTSRATVNRVLRNLEDAGTVKLSRNRVHVLDRAALAKRTHL
ncbi:MAG: Crp/Fnr family transcriptional regulator [Sporichthyaceae bacterium]